MYRIGRGICCLLVSCCLLSGCLNGLWTGATLLYDRHNVYKKISDYQLFVSVNNRLYKDRQMKPKDRSIEVAVFNGDVLLVGYVPTAALRDEAYARVAAVKGQRRLFNQVSVRKAADNSIQDSWITGEIRSQMLVDSAIDPSKFKVVTSDQVVYLMGDVEPVQAELVITIARQCAGVKRVVTLFKYYHLTDNMSK